MSILKGISSIIERKVVEKELTDITAEQLDVLLNQAFDAIPFIGTANKIRNVYSSIQDMLLMDKVNAFLNEFSNMSQDERLKFSQKLQDDPVYGQKAGEFIIASVNRHDFAFKSKMLAKVCKCYSRELFSKHDFVKMKNAIEVLLVHDLEKIVDQKNFFPSKFDENFALFVSVGVVKEEIDPHRVRMFAKSNDDRALGRLTEIKMTEFGYRFFAVLREDMRYFSH